MYVIVSVISTRYKKQLPIRRFRTRNSSFRDNCMLASPCTLHGSTNIINFKDFPYKRPKFYFYNYIRTDSFNDASSVADLFDPLLCIRVEKIISKLPCIIWSRARSLTLIEGNESITF